MKQIKITFLLLTGMMFSSFASASNLSYNVSLTTDSVDNPSAFGGISVGDVFSGNFGADSTNLAGQVDTYNDTSVVATTPDDGIDFMFNLAVGNHTYSFAYDAARDYITNPDYGFAETTITVNADALASSPTNVTDIAGFSINQYGDADSFELYLDTAQNSWSAYDPTTSYGASGSLSVSQVPVPAAIWLFATGVVGLMSYRKQLAV